MREKVCSPLVNIRISPSSYKLLLHAKKLTGRTYRYMADQAIEEWYDKWITLTYPPVKK